MAASNDQELLLIIQSLKVIRDEVNANLDALAARVKRLLPPETSTRYQRFTGIDWGRFLDG